MDNKEKLTPAASEAIDEIVTEFRNKLIVKANDLASKDIPEYKEITLRNVLEAKDAILYSYPKSHRNPFYLRKFTLLVFLFFSLALAFIVSTYLADYLNIEYKSSRPIDRDYYILFERFRYIALVFLLTLLPFVIYLFNHFLLQRKKDLKPYEYEIISRWQTIEKLGNEIINTDGGNAESKSFGFKLQYLREILYRLNLDVDLMELLNTRNKALHEGHQITKQELSLYISQADQIIDALEKYEYRKNDGHHVI